jgi:hypothetical protein
MNTIDLITLKWTKLLLLILSSTFKVLSNAEIPVFSIFSCQFYLH